MHRHLKTSHIHIHQFRPAMITDFGTSYSERDDHTLTTEAGTVYYAAPEMFVEGDYTNKVDVWSSRFPNFRATFSCHHETSWWRNAGDSRVPCQSDESRVLRCWSMEPENRPSFDDILGEFQSNHFAVFPDASPKTIFEYARSMFDWKSTNSKRASA
jgi:serine/threonine protein kinase